ncbi:type II toxin-antitoxin system VapC family toxin [Methermicoccus shengliensis]|uniref:Ribonuclease VapC n=1 Tax=Methermicoccus shengliensis TaxID=660064 RepID=A0A832VMF8_9EURY|nr:type II toxin-antitoxin system VapC family toxin [Methermicoccus shengliensis]KUK29694.1 MAG: putative ribonuclease VapC [Methanosarcinales archeaon 56_1174]MDI3488152.1 hypothetical protein [Methanosarcinales archaeon]HIH69241.1 type II toxin-antitoxin system VapC family toxin [Methermicoccus shengliensis]
MAMACFDTTFLIDLSRLKKQHSDFFDTLMDEHTLKTSAISVAELLWGAYNKGSAEEIEFTKSLLSKFEILPFDARAADIYASISTSLRQKGISLKAFDELIAATAIRFNEPLITRDREFKRVPGLEVIEYELK